MKGFPDDHAPPPPTVDEQLAGTMFEHPPWPVPPAPFSEPTTSKAAADEIQPKAGTIRAQVLALVVARNGCTAEEVETALGLPGNTVRPRLWELVKAGLIYKSLAVRPNRSGRAARVYLLG